MPGRFQKHPGMRVYGSVKTPYFCLNELNRRMNFPNVFRRSHPLLTSGLLLVFLFCSCRNAAQSSENVPARTQRDSCQTLPEQSYAVYVPTHARSEKMPLWIVLDPHGDGNLGVRKFQLAGERYRCVVVGSNWVQNNREGYVEAINHLIADVRTKYPVTEAVYLAGFSGGARMALDFSSQQAVNGVIACGALGNPAQLALLRAPLYALTSTDDFNFTETAQYLLGAAVKPDNVAIELTQGSHAWPDSLTLSDAAGFLMLGDGTCTEGLEAYCQQRKQRMEALFQKGDAFKAGVMARTMASVKAFRQQEPFESLASTWENSPAYSRQRELLGRDLQQEMSLRSAYIDAFTSKDTEWWMREIGAAETQIRTETDSYHRDTFRRLYAFWGVACYSLCTQAFQTQNRAQLEKITRIYRRLEPHNPDQLYFSAVLCQWKGQASEISALYREAKAASESDFSRWESLIRCTVR